MWKTNIIQILSVAFMLLQHCESTINRNELKETRKSLNYPRDDAVRVMNGDEASLYEYTFMAALVRYLRNTRKLESTDSNETPFGRLVCGGAIIHKDWIITAARCFNNKSDLHVYEAYAGVVILGNILDQQTRLIHDISIHPQYKPSSDEYNLAMVRVIPSFRITSNVRAGYLPTGPLSITSGERCHILGFAREYETDTTYEDRLIKVQLHAIDYKDFLSTLKFLKTRQPYKLTSKNYGLIQIQEYPHNNSQGACEGDVGGPCICGYKIQGIIAHYTTKTCYETGYPTTIVDVGHHLNWVRATILQLNTVPINLGIQNANTRYILKIFYFILFIINYFKYYCKI